MDVKFYQQMPLNRGKIMVRLIDPPAKPGLLVEIRGVDERQPKYAEIINVGPPRISEVGYVFPMKWKVGDRIMLNGLPGTDLAVAGDNIRIIHEENDTHGGPIPHEAWPA